MHNALKGDKMTLGKPKALTDENIRAINAVLEKDQRVEIIPVKDGVKVVRVRRETIK